MWKVAVLDYTEKNIKYLFLKHIKAFIHLEIQEQRMVIITIIILSNKKEIKIIKKYRFNEFMDYLLKE